LLVQSCSTPVKSSVAGGVSGDVCSLSSVNSAGAELPVNATRLVQLANVAIDSQDNVLDCRVDSVTQHDVCDGIKSEDAAGQSSDDAVLGSLVSDGQLSRGNSIYIM